VLFAVDVRKVMLPGVRHGQIALVVSRGVAVTCAVGLGSCRGWQRVGRVRARAFPEQQWSEADARGEFPALRVWGSGLPSVDASEVATPTGLGA